MKAWINWDPSNHMRTVRLTKYPRARPPSFSNNCRKWTQIPFPSSSCASSLGGEAPASCLLSIWCLVITGLCSPRAGNCSEQKYLWIPWKCLLKAPWSLAGERELSSHRHACCCSALGLLSMPTEQGREFSIEPSSFSWFAIHSLRWQTLSIRWSCSQGSPVLHNRR